MVWCLYIICMFFPSWKLVRPRDIGLLRNAERANKHSLCDPDSTRLFLCWLRTHKASLCFCFTCILSSLSCASANILYYCTVALIKISIHSRIGSASGKSSSLVLVLLSTQKGATTVMASRRAGNTPTQPVVYEVKLIQDCLLPVCAHNEICLK